MSRLKGVNHWIVGFLLVAFTLGSSYADPNSPKVRSVKVDVNQGTVELSVQADKPVQVRTLQLGTPKPELVFDIYPSVLWGKKETKPVGQFGIEDIRVAQFSSDPDVTRVVADLSKPLQFKIVASDDQKNLKISFGGKPENSASPAPALQPAPAASLPQTEPPKAQAPAPAWEHARIVQRVVMPEDSGASYSHAAPGLRPTMASPSLQTKLTRIYLSQALKRNERVTPQASLRAGERMSKSAEGALKKKKKAVAKAAAQPKEQAISFSWKNADLTDVIRSLADRMGLNVIVDTSVKGTVTLDLKNVPAGQALGMILSINGYASRQIGNILVVGPPDKLDKLPTTPISVGPQVIQVIPLENAKPSDLRDTVAGEYPEVKVEVDPRTNSLLVKGPVSAIRKVKQLVSELDKPVVIPPAVASQREVLQLNYAQVKDVLSQVKPLLPSDAVLIADDRMNSLIVNGSQPTIDMVKSFISAVDVVSPQVMLEMQVIDLDELASKELGINWSSAVKTNFAETAAGEGGPVAAGAAGGIIPLPTPGGSVVTGNSINLTNLGIHTFVRDNLAFTATINWAINNTKSKVLGAPRIATMDRKEANIQLGQNYPIVYFDPRAGLYQAQYVPIGVQLKVTPTISPNGDIQIKIDTQVSDVAGTIQNFPITNTRNAQANLTIKNGQTIVLGGLLKETSSDSVDKVPLLGDIPILGEFFRHRKTSKEKRDLIISITPTLIASK